MHTIRTTLAGRFGGRGRTDLRIVSDTSWPGIQLRYTLSRDGAVVDRAEERLSDMNFMLSANRYSSADRLRYEKGMLDDWFAKRFGGR